jgi:hypothetical protein
MLPLTVCLLGLLLGARHAFEPDHLAALSTLVAEQRGARRAAALGALWGTGHAGALLLVGLVLALVRARMPDRLSDAFELAVAVMLVALGARALLRAVREGAGGAASRHHHGGRVHEHAGPHRHLHLAGWTFGRRSFFIGVVHGLAGSGSLTALALASLPTTAARLLYVALFGAGSIGGMALLSGVAGWPLGRLARHPAAARLLAGATGLLSLAMGIAWGWSPLGRLAG